MIVRILSMIVVFCLIVACEKKTDVAQKNPEPKVEKKEVHRCANCGMYTEKHPNWEQKIVSADKGTMYFDGARCMFKILLDSTTAPQHIEEIQVKDYYSLQYIDGKKAFYVIGSDVLGPMGNELIPFRTKSAADDFLKDHNGKKTILYDEVDMALVMKLAGKMKMM